jgi:hypothetical protein
MTMKSTMTITAPQPITNLFMSRNSRGYLVPRQVNHAHGL